MAYIIDSENLRDLVETGRQALRGDSNDAEHDALFKIIASLETLQPNGKRKRERRNAKIP